MADDSMSKRVKNALKTVLSAITYNGEPAFTAVAGTTHGEFDGYPALRLLPGDQTTEKATVAENDRTLSYIARVHLPLESTLNSEATYDQMYDLTDLILDTLDVGDHMDALHTADPTLQNLLMLNATRGDWVINESSAGIVLMCDTNIEVKYSLDLY